MLGVLAGGAGAGAVEWVLAGMLRFPFFCHYYVIMT